MERRPDDPEVLVRLLDRGPYLALLVGGDGVIRWVSEQGVRRMFGYEPAEILGTNILEHLDLEWDPAAIGSIAEALDADGVRLPTVFRAIRKDGSPVILEAWASAELQDPVLQGLVAFVRRWDERLLLDEALESLGGGEPVDTTFRLLVEAMACETLEAEGVILHGTEGHGGGAATCSPALPAELTAFDDRTPGTPWTDARRTASPVTRTVTELPEPWRSSATAAGFGACWAWPVPDSRRGGAIGAVVAWRRDDQREADHSRVQAMQRLARVASLALERHETIDALHRAATTDALTGTANRARFYEALNEALVDPSPGRVGLLYLDLDGFKPINDDLGHAAGDEVLTVVTERLTRAVRDRDLVARLGGDEFAVLCPEQHAIDALEALAARLLEVVVAPVWVPGASVCVGVSIGGVVADLGSCSADALVEAADAAMYEVKMSGKGGWRIVELRG